MRKIILGVVLCSLFLPSAPLWGIAPESRMAQEELDLRMLIDQIKERGKFGPLTLAQRERAEDELSDALRNFIRLLPEEHRPASLLELAPKIKTTNAFSKYRVEKELPLTIVFDGSIYSAPPYSENVWRIAYTYDSQFDALTVICSKVANEKFIVGLAGVRYYEPEGQEEYDMRFGGLLRESVVLADAMDRKGFLWDDPFDGGQVTILPHPETKGQEREVLERWTKSSVDVGLLGKRFVVKPGLGTGEEEMDYVQEAALIAKEELEVAGFGIGETFRPFATSRPLGKEGWPHIEWQLTGRGMAEGIITAIRMLKKYREEVPEFGLAPDEELSVIIQGFGDIGSAVADILLKNFRDYNIKVVGVSDKMGAIYDPNGLDREALIKIRKGKEKVSDYEKYKSFSEEGGVLKNRDDLPFQKATIFVPASVGNVITRDNYKRLKAKAIIEGADVAVAPEVARPLQDEMHILYIPGIVVNAGGLYASFEEVFHSHVETVLEAPRDIKEHLFHMIESNAISAAKLLMRWWIVSQREMEKKTPSELVEDLTEALRRRRNELLAKPTDSVLERAEIEAVRNVSEGLAMLIAACDEARHEVFFNKGMTTEELMRDLDSVDIYEQRDAARFLGERGELVAVEALIGILRDKGRDWRVRRNAAEALGNIAADEALLALLEVADDEAEMHVMREQARWSLERMVADLESYREVISGRGLGKIPKRETGPESTRDLASEILKRWYKNSKRRKIRPTIIAITGYAATGKTYFADELAAAIKALLPEYIQEKKMVSRISPEVLHIDFDNYLFAKEDRPSQLHTLGKMDVEKKETWIGKWEFGRFFSDIKKLYEGRPIVMPLFDQVSQKRKRGTEPLIPRNNIIIVEGIFIMTDRGTNKYYDMKIFLDASSEVRMAREIERYLSGGKYNNMTVKEVWDKVRRKRAAEDLPLIQHERLFANIIISTDNIPVREFVSAFGEVAVRGYWSWRGEKEKAHPGIGLSLVEQERRLRDLFGDVGFDRIRGSDLEEKVWTRLCQNALVPEKTPLFYAVAELVAEQFKEEWPGKGAAERQRFLEGLRERFKLDDEDFRILVFSALAPSRLLEENVQPRRDASTFLLAPQSVYRVTWRTLLEYKAKGRKITMAAAYNKYNAAFLDKAGMDVILVGDSVMMNEYGEKDTKGATMPIMLRHTKAASRGAKRALLIGDMPIDSYSSPEIALENARRFMEIEDVGAVKLEGGKEVAHIVKFLVENGIPVMGHIGHTPQTAKGYRMKGATKEEALGLLEDAKRLEAAGAFAIVMELIDARVAREITKQVRVPTIGIGAGRYTDGQVLVAADLWGESGFKGRFVREFADIADIKERAAKEYIREIAEGRFPTDAESFLRADAEVISCL